MEDIMEKMQKMLNSEDGKATINGLLGSLQGTKEEEKEQPLSQNDGGIDLDMMTKMTSIFGALQNQQGKHFDLMHAIRPYLSTKKQGKFDVALRLLQLSKLPNIQSIIKG